LPPWAVPVWGRVRSIEIGPSGKKTL
jgi:hypothetical protein